MFGLNKDVATRDKIIFGTESGVKYLGGIRRFEGLTVDQLTELEEYGFLYLDDAQNYAPSVGEFIEFMKKFPEFTAHGYAVSVERSDYRVSIEGVEKHGEATPEELEAFEDLFSDADEFTATSEGLRCWYD